MSLDPLVEEAVAAAAAVIDGYDLEPDCADEIVLRRQSWALEAVRAFVTHMEREYVGDMYLEQSLRYLLDMLEP